MDSYSGSQPRKFISFQLGEEKNGQPTQDLKVIDAEDNSDQTAAMETNLIVSDEQSVLQAEPEDQRTEQL